MNLILASNKKYLIAAIVLVLGASLGIYLFQKPKSAEKPKDSQAYLKLLRENETPEQKQARVWNDDYELVDTAVEEKDASVCVKLNQSENFDKCVWTVATANNNPKFCEEIKEEILRKKCLDFIESQKIIKGTDVSACLKLSNQEIRKNCQTVFFWKWEDVSKCDGFLPDEKKACSDIILKNRALRENDSKLCGQIGDATLRDDCQQSILNKPKDSDKDGLADNMERSYGTNPFKSDTDSDGLNDNDELMVYRTNPNKADTDGDGFADGDEVKRGFDPKGAGLKK